MHRHLHYISVCNCIIVAGNNARSAAVNAITYLDNCPFKYTILRILKIDFTLVLTMLTLATTYTIAMIQFTHIFG